MTRLALIAGFLLFAIGSFGIFFPQLFGQSSQPSDSGPEDTAVQSSYIPSAGNPSADGQAEVQGGPNAVAKIDRIVVAGIVLPAGAGMFFVGAGLLGGWITKTKSWFYVGVMGGLPGALMLLLSGERIADWFQVPWSLHWIPVLQLLLGCLVCTVTAFQMIQNQLPGSDEEENATAE